MKKGPYNYGTKSKAAYRSLHPLLQKLADAVIKEIDVAITDSSRNKAQQELAFKQGNSKVHFGDSAHNWETAVAMDLLPMDMKNWDDIAAFVRMGKVVTRIAKELNIPLRGLGDPNRDGNTKDGWDYPHFELHPWRSFADKSKPYKGK